MVTKYRNHRGNYIVRDDVDVIGSVIRKPRPTAKVGVVDFHAHGKLGQLLSVCDTLKEAVAVIERNA